MADYKGNIDGDGLNHINNFVSILASETSANTIGTAGQTTFEGSGANLTSLPSAFGDVSITNTADTTALDVNQTWSAANTSDAITLDLAGAGNLGACNGFKITCGATDFANGIEVKGDTGDKNSLLFLQNTSGTIGSLGSIVNAGTNGNGLFVQNTNAANSNTCIALDHAGTGDVLNITNSGSGNDIGSDNWSINNAGTFTGEVPVSSLANGTDGELITWDAAGVATTVATGTANQVLTSNGAGAAPTFQDLPGGTSADSILEALAHTNNKFYFSLEDLLRYDVGGTVTTTLDSLQFTGATGSADDSVAWGISSTYGINYSSDFDISSQVRISLNGSPVDIVIFVGIFNQGGTDIASITQTLNHAGVFFRKQAGTYTAYSSAADGTTQSQTSLGTSWDPESGAVTVRVVRVGGTISYYLDGVLQGTETTNLPIATSVTGTNSTMLTSWSESSGGTAYANSVFASFYGVLTTRDL